MEQEKGKKTFTAFRGENRVASGGIEMVVAEIKRIQDSDTNQTVIIFEDGSGTQIDLDLSGSSEDAVLRQVDRFRMEDTSAGKKGRGRPKLGVVSKEITLLPRHWDWLGNQSGGASVTLRKLVETAMRSGKNRVRTSRDATFKFMNVIAGNLTNFEEAIRALYRGDQELFYGLILNWPTDIRGYINRLSENAWES